MKRILLLSSILLLSAVWAAAQYGSQPSPSSQSSSGTSQTTIQGCLSGSVGNYSLTDKSGTTYQLTGGTAKLENQVGHTIQLTGMSSSTDSSANTSSNPSGAMSGSTSPSGSSTGSQLTFTVISFKHISANCMDSH